MSLNLIIGNKNYSSWSFRPWIAMKATGIAFDEELIPLETPEFRARLDAVSGTGKVPTLIDGEIRVWESLAILEYLADKFPDKKLWPSDPAARAHARAISSEMHAGFVPLRQNCPMNMWRPVLKRHLGDDVKKNRPDRLNVERLPQALRAGRRFPVRLVRRRRRDVCAGGVAFPHL